MGPCSQVAITKACMQCASFGNQCAAIETPTPGPQPGPSGTCVVWGDPHILTFDKKRVDFYTQGQYWLVKSATVQIQGLYKPTHATSGLSVMKAIAFGGPFLKGHKLVIETQNANFDGKPILGGFPSDYDNGPLGINVHYNSQGSTMQNGREGKAMHVVHLQLPRNVNVQVNRWME